MAGPPGSCRLRTEAAAVAVRADPQAPSERPAHGLHGAEARLAGDRLDRHRAGLERDPRVLNACQLDVTRRRHVGLLAEGAREVAFAHAGATGESGNREILAEVVGQPLLQVPQRLAV